MNIIYFSFNNNHNGSCSEDCSLILSASHCYMHALYMQQFEKLWKKLVKGKKTLRRQDCEPLRGTRLNQRETHPHLGDAGLCHYHCLSSTSMCHVVQRYI